MFCNQENRPLVYTLVYNKDTSVKVGVFVVVSFSCFFRVCLYFQRHLGFLVHVQRIFSFLYVRSTDSHDLQLLLDSEQDGSVVEPLGLVLLADRLLNSEQY